MSFTLQDVVTNVRGQHPAFEKARVPSKTIADAATRYQRRLVQMATQRNRDFCTQSASIVFQISAANAVGTVGAGTTGSTPAEVSGTTFAQAELPAGAAIVLDDSGVELDSRPVTSATALGLFYTGGAWTINQYQDKVVEIVGGAGAGQVRDIASNTSNALALAAGDEWDTIPDATSLFRILGAVPAIADDFAAVTAAPFLGQRLGYLVKLNAQGQPYLDLTAPLVATIDVGIPLPPHYFLVGGTVRLDNADDTAPLRLTSYTRRLETGGWFPAYELNGQLFLIGGQSEWTGVQSIELQYAPIPPALADLTDYFLLDDTALEPIVAHCALVAGRRVSGLPDVPKIDMNELRQEAADSEAVWLRQVAGRKRSRVSTIREW